MLPKKIAVHHRGFLAELRRDPFVCVCLGMLALLSIAAFGNGLLSSIGIHLTGYSFEESTRLASDTLQAPSWKHWCGTDLNGRDLFTRILTGAQISLLVALFGTVISLGVGVGYGMVSGYLGGVFDNLMMRIVDVLFALPSLLLAIIFISVSEGPLTNEFVEYGIPTDGVPPRVILLILFLGLTQWMTMARIIRGQVLVLRQQQFVQAAKALGQSHLRILASHLLPNLSGLIVIYLTLTIPAIMVDEAFLSFLGLGVQAPLASWGTLISDAAKTLNPIQLYWWLLIFPGGTMSLTLLALNFVGDFLRDRFDPRATQRDVGSV